VTEALLKTGKHSVTAITRIDSQNAFPEGVTARKVDYRKLETVIDALRGHDALVITLSAQVPVETEMQLIKAAGEAGVPWILPNEWAPDTANEALVADVFVFEQKRKYLSHHSVPANESFTFAGAVRKTIADIGKSSFVALSTGFWYEYSLAIPEAFGVDFANHAVTLFDEGETKVSVSTFPQVLLNCSVCLDLGLHVRGWSCRRRSFKPAHQIRRFEQ
jgi:hypothetical protein